MYEAKITFSSVEFQRICKTFTDINNFILIQSNIDKLKLSVFSNNINGTYTLKENEGNDENNKCTIISFNDPIMYCSLWYLNKISFANAFSKKVTLYLSNELPLIIEYNFENKVTLRLYLPPKYQGKDAINHNSLFS